MNRRKFNIYNRLSNSLALVAGRSIQIKNRIDLNSKSNRIERILTLPSLGYTI